MELSSSFQGKSTCPEVSQYERSFGCTAGAPTLYLQDRRSSFVTSGQFPPSSETVPVDDDAQCDAQECGSLEPAARQQESRPRVLRYEAPGTILRAAQPAHGIVLCASSHVKICKF